jgi:hypothetical protein
MAGDRKEPGLGRPSPDRGADETEGQDDFLDLIPERLAPRSRAPEPEDDDPALAAGSKDPDAEPFSEEPRGPYPEDHLEDELDEDDEGRAGGSKGVMVAVVIGAVAAGIAGWYLFLRDEPQQVAETTPVITSDNQPYKIKPADPGGMDVPDTDKMVYDRLGQNSQGGGVESLLPEVAAPTAPPVSPAPADSGGTLAPLPEAEVAATPQPDVIEEPPAAADPPPMPAPEPPQVQAPAVTPEPTPPAPEPEAEAAPKPPQPKVVEPPAQTAAPAATAPKATATPPSGGGNSMVQLAAVRDQAGAEAAWKRLQGANTDLLGNLTLDVQRADLGEKGIFYRIRAKGLASADEAKGLCEKLKARGQGCLVVR